MKKVLLLSLAIFANIAAAKNYTATLYLKKGECQPIVQQGLYTKIFQNMITSDIKNGELLVTCYIHADSKQMIDDQCYATVKINEEAVAIYDVYLSLSLFVNADGSYKKDYDTVILTFKYRKNNETVTDTWTLFLADFFRLPRYVKAYNNQGSCIIA
jgi:hypothetical protein